MWVDIYVDETLKLTMHNVFKKFEEFFFFWLGSFIVYNKVSIFEWRGEKLFDYILALKIVLSFLCMHIQPRSEVGSVNLYSSIHPHCRLL